MRLQRRWAAPAAGARAIALAGVGLVAALAACGGGTPRGPKPDALEMGRTTYVRYCTSCHGKQGRGDGPLAADLRVPVADLTALASNNGGTYPEERVTQVIIGGGTVRGHGTSDMPAWGPVFGQSAGNEGATVDEAVGNLNRYLRSIQRSP